MSGIGCAPRDFSQRLTKKLFSFGPTRISKPVGGTTAFQKPFESGSNCGLTLASRFCFSNATHKVLAADTALGLKGWFVSSETSYKIQIPGCIDLPSLGSGLAFHEAIPNIEARSDAKYSGSSPFAEVTNVGMPAKGFKTCWGGAWFSMRGDCASSSAAISVSSCFRDARNTLSLLFKSAMSALLLFCAITTYALNALICRSISFSVFVIKAGNFSTLAPSFPG